MDQQSSLLYRHTPLLQNWWVALLFADTIVRNIVKPEVIAAGMMTALTGAPYFIYLLLKKA